MNTPTCRVIRPEATYAGKQGLSYQEGVCAENTGATGISMMLLTIPPGGRGQAHVHQNHESAIYLLTGEADMWFGENLAERVTVRAGEFIYIPAGMPHLPVNTTSEPVTAVLARTDPNEQESVVLRPDLDARVPA